MSHSFASRAAISAISALRNGGKSAFASTPTLSTRSCATGAFVKASTRRHTTLPRAPSQSSVQQAPTPDGPGREPSVMPQQSKASQADFGPLKFYDWAESVYDPTFESQPAPASTKCLSQSSVPNTLHAPESGAVRCDTNSYSQDSLILSSDSSPVFSTAASSKGDQSSTPTGTAVPHGSGRSRGFKRLGTGIFGQLHEKYPPSQSR